MGAMSDTPWLADIGLVPCYLVPWELVPWQIRHKAYRSENPYGTYLPVLADIGLVSWELLQDDLRR